MLQQGLDLMKAPLFDSNCVGGSLGAFLRGFLGDSKETTDEPLLRQEEIQGNVLPGFNKDLQTLMFLRVHNRTAAKLWLQRITPYVANMKEVLTFKRLYQLIRDRRGSSNLAVRSSWVNIAFSYSCLEMISPDASMFRDRAFREGAFRRTNLLSERSDAKIQEPWVVGGPSREADILLMLASDDPWGLGQIRTLIDSFMLPGIELIHVDEGESPPFPFSAHEHFGFRDGISQPGIRGRLSQDFVDYFTARENPLDSNQGKPGQVLLWPGEFVFGYPSQDPSDPVRPGSVSDPGPSWAHNGSFLAFRRYEQDVKAFQSFIHNTAAELALRVPSFKQMTPSYLAAKLVGRWFSGTPLLRSPEIDDPRIAQNSCADNDFEYLHPPRPLSHDQAGKCGDESFPPAIADPFGEICPFASHIRRAYPRDDLGSRSEVETHRIIRRGIPFGKPYPQKSDRGLLFIGYMTSIERQFEFIVARWFNSSTLKGTTPGLEPLLGRTLAEPRTFDIPYRDAEGRLESLTLQLPDFIRVTGGGYFFAPSLSALKSLSKDNNQSHL